MLQFEWPVHWNPSVRSILEAERIPLSNFLVFARCLIFSRNSQKIPHKNAAQIHNATLIHLTNFSFVVYFQNDSVLLIATNGVLHIYHSDVKFTKKICAVFLTLFQFVQPGQGVMRAAAILNCPIAFEVKYLDSDKNQNCLKIVSKLNKISVYIWFLYIIA